MSRNNWQEPLEQANEIRFARARIKRDISAGRLRLPDVVDPHVELPNRDEIERAIENMKLEQLVSAAPRVGPSRYGKLWAQFAGAPARNGLRVNALGAVRRAQLASFLRVKGIGV